MRILAAIAACVVTSVLMVGATLLVVVHHRETDGWLLLSGLSLALLFCGPPALGSLHAFWDDRRSRAAGSAFRVWWIIIASAQAAGAIGIVAWAVGVGAPPWIPVLFVGTAVVLTILAILLGRHLGRLEERRDPGVSWEAPALIATVSPIAVRRKITVIVLSFVIALAVTGVGLWVVFGLLLGEWSPEPLIFALQISFLVATLAAIIVSWPMNRALRDVTGRDLGRAKAFSRIVLRGKDETLVPGDEPAAARYAAIASVAMPFQLAYLMLLYAALILGQVPRLFDPDRSWFSIALLAFLLVAIVMLTPMFVLQVLRARRYARAHPTLAFDGAQATQPG